MEKFIMLKSTKLSEQKFQLKDYVILGPVLIAVLLMLVGAITLNQGMAGEWTTSEDHMVFAGIGAVLLLCGVAVFIFGPHLKTFIFDQQTGSVNYTFKKLLKENQEEIPLSEIKEIVITQHLTRTSNNKNSKSRSKVIVQYHLELQTGVRVLMGERKRRSSIMAFAGESVPKHIRLLSEFLSIPVTQESLKDQLKDVANTVKDVIKTAQAAKAAKQDTPA